MKKKKKQEQPIVENTHSETSQSEPPIPTTYLTFEKPYSIYNVSEKIKPDIWM